MIRKSHLSIAFAGLALFACSEAFACSTSLWGAGLTGGAGGAQSALGGVVAGQPNGGGGGTARRFAGLCGLRAPAAGAIVQDGSPATENAYISRFYAHVNFQAGAVPRVFNFATGAPDATNTRVFAIQYNRNDQRFEAVNEAGTVSPIGAVNSAPNNAFYHVHSSWTRASGALDVVVTGNFIGTIPAPPTAAFVATTANLTGFGSVVAGEQFAQAGWVSGPTGSAGINEVNIDAFESRRSTAIPKLCPGDANASNSVSVSDRAAITAEILGTLNSGTPDADWNGAVSVSDRARITALLASGRSACDGSW